MSDKKRKCTFTPRLESSYKCFKKGRNENEAECLICKTGTYVSVANKGIGDLKAHVETAKHKRSITEIGKFEESNVASFFVVPKSEIDVAAAEGTWAFHTVKHHNSFKSNDCTSGLFKSMFHDSKIASNYASARTKTAAIATSVLAPHSVDEVLNTLEKNSIPFIGVSTDGSNHGAIKVFPVLIYYFDWKSGGIQCKLIEVHSVNNETSETIATLVNTTLQEKKLAGKCIAFSGDNCNTMFGGRQRKENGDNVFAKLKKCLNKLLIGVGCPNHILNNGAHSAVEVLDIDIDNVLYKSYQYFHIYTVRTEELKDFCDFVEIEYKQLLSHSASRWLSLFPGVERYLTMYPALKSYFLSQAKPPSVLKNFFLNELGEAYLYLVHSLMSIFDVKIKELEREKNSVIEVLSILISVKEILTQRLNKSFVPMYVKSMLTKKREEGFDKECDQFQEQVTLMYQTAIDYISDWTVQFEEFKCFLWMSFDEVPDWDELELCLKYLSDKGVQVYDTKCFDQFTNFKKFVEKSIGDKDFRKLLCHEKWVKYFEQSKSEDCYSELLTIAQFVFAIPAHNANIERVFSLMQSQWSDERNRLLLDTSVKPILFLQYNFKDFSCKQFYNYLRSNQKLLKEIKSSDKYIVSSSED